MAKQPKNILKSCAKTWQTKTGSIRSRYSLTISHISFLEFTALFASLHVGCH